MEIENALTRSLDMTQLLSARAWPAALLTTIVSATF